MVSPPALSDLPKSLVAGAPSLRSILAVENPVGEPVQRIDLRGRAAECAQLEDLVSAIRRGESRALVVRGEAGIGKTALLQHLIASASDLTVVRAIGVESEMELAFAS